MEIDHLYLQRRLLDAPQTHAQRLEALYEMVKQNKIANKEDFVELSKYANSLSAGFSKPEEINDVKATARVVS